MNKLIFPILAIVFVSACLGGGEQTTAVEGKGLEITSFTVDQSEIQSGRTLRVTMDVENSGASSVTDAESLAFLIAPGDWDFSASSENQNFGRDLDSADPVRGTPAETDQITWRLIAPTIPTGQTRSDEFEGRVYYDYKTTATGTVWLYSDAEYESIRTSGGSLSKASFTSSEAPVKVEVTVSPDPPVIVSDGEIFTLTIKITNVGGGIVYEKSAVDYSAGDISFSSEDLDIVDVNVDSPFDIINPNDCIGQQELIRGRDITLSCDLRVDDVPVAKQSFAFEIEVDYGYYKASTLSVNVLGR